MEKVTPKKILKSMNKDIPEPGQERLFYWATVGFIVLIIVQIFDNGQFTKPTPILLVMGGFILLSVTAATSFYGLVRIASPGYLDEIHHSSLINPGPQGTASIHLPNGRTLDLVIFALGGYNAYHVFQNQGGGRWGYVIAPEKGYIQVGGSITVLFGLRKFTYAQVPVPVREKLTSQMVNFKIERSPIYLAYLPPKSAALRKLLAVYSTSELEGQVSDLIEYIKMLEENVTHSDITRKNMGQRGIEAMNYGKIRRKRLEPPQEGNQ